MTHYFFRKSRTKATLTFKMEKMSFNPDPIKQATEVCFSHKRDKEVYPPLKCNNNDVQSENSQKHLRLVLDSKLDFNEHVNIKINKCNKSIGIMKKLSLTLSRNSLLTILKSFFRPILDYEYIISDKRKIRNSPM